jgi:hypothetical protein
VIVALASIRTDSQRHLGSTDCASQRIIGARAVGKMRAIVSKRYSTSTLIDSATCVPWLAAEGPLAYTPENPPATDYFFQYSWILPEIFDFKVHKRRHHYFGTPIRDHAKPLFEFWRQARRREVERVHMSLGSFVENRLSAPVAVYRAKLRSHDESKQWLFIQHGSYQWISSADQPHVEQGQVLLYRGIQREKTFRYPSFERNLRQLANRRTWNRYLALQWSMLSDSSLSFNTVHDRTKRCETAFLNDGTWLGDRLAAEAGLDIESDGFAHVLWDAATSAFSLERWVAEKKFGPHFVIAKTPINNIRLTTFFAGEAEVRVVERSRIRVLESIGCTVAT